MAGAKRKSRPLNMSPQTYRKLRKLNGKVGRLAVAITLITNAFNAIHEAQLEIQEEITKYEQGKAAQQNKAVIEEQSHRDTCEG